MEEDIILRVLACLVWADGQVTPEEQKKVAEFASNAGGLGTPEQIEKYLEADPEITQEEIASLSDEAFPNLITFGFELVNCERPATEQEREILKVVAGAKLSPEKVEKLFQWFEHHKQAEILFDEVFE